MPNRDLRIYRDFTIKTVGDYIYLYKETPLLDFHCILFYIALNVCKNKNIQIARQGVSTWSRIK